MVLVLVVFIACCLVALVAYGLYWRIRRRVIHHRPPNQPDPTRREEGKTAVVCAGDSITHGIVSANYVDMLERWLPAAQFQFFNAGINADLSYTLLRRLDTIIQVRPDIITVLIGTNDVNATLSSEAVKLYRKISRLQPDEHPSFATYQANYKAIVHRLKTETSAQIALVSLPVMSEDLTNEANQRADQYSAFIKDLAQAEGLVYLPVRERMKDWLLRHPKPLRYAYKDHYRMMNIAVAKNQLLGHSWDKLSVQVGQDLTFDHLHLNSRGAALIATLIEPFLRSTSAAQAPVNAAHIAYQA